jgi:hypothetical protein
VIKSSPHLAAVRSVKDLQSRNRSITRSLNHG